MEGAGGAAPWPDRKESGRRQREKRDSMRLAGDEWGRRSERCVRSLEFLPRGEKATGRSATARWGQAGLFRSSLWLQLRGEL